MPMPIYAPISLQIAEKHQVSPVAELTYYSAPSLYFILKPNTADQKILSCI